MKLLKFFYGMHLSYKLFSTIGGDLLKSLHKDSMSVTKVKELPNCQLEKELSLKTLQKMRTDKASDLFYECVSVRASKHEFISITDLSRKQKHSNYILLDSYFQLDGKPMRSEGQDSNLLKDNFRVNNFKALDLIMTYMRTRFDQLRFTAFSFIWSSQLTL